MLDEEAAGGKEDTEKEKAMLERQPGRWVVSMQGGRVEYERGKKRDPTYSGFNEGTCA